MIDYNLTIGFSTTNGIISRIFRWFMYSDISHTFICFNLFNIKMIVGSEEDGLDWKPINKFTKENKIKYIFKPIGPRIDVSFRDFLIKHGDLEYDFMTTGVMGIKNRLKFIWKSFGKYLKRLMKRDKFNCVEVLTEILHDAGYDNINKYDIIDTQQLLEICQNSDEFELIYDYRSNK